MLDASFLHLLEMQEKCFYACNAKYEEKKCKKRMTNKNVNDGRTTCSIRAISCLSDM